MANKSLTILGNEEQVANAKKRAALARHPHHHSHVPISAARKLSDAEADVYAELNNRLHDQMTEVARAHFRGVAAPTAYAAGGRDTSFQEEIGTLFTYQNLDWYGPSYEGYIAVLDGYISSDLLIAFQSLLVNDFSDWCIVVVPSPDINFGDDGREIAIFSNQILLSTTTAKNMKAN
jgi:hypothetical protein